MDGAFASIMYKTTAMIVCCTGGTVAASTKFITLLC